MKMLVGIKRSSIVLLMLLLSGILPGADSVPSVLNGIDVLREQDFAPMAGKRVGLVTNHTGLAADGTTSVEVFHKTKSCRLAAIFSPEHGLSGKLDDKFNSGVDEATSLPVYSLYGDTRRPTPDMLRDIDVLVFDIQDIGARFYTYITTMAYCMEEAAKAKIPIFVLDRPNPVGGARVEGPMLDPDKTSFVGYMPLPVRHGMTLGELARYFNEENNIGAQLHVIPMRGWSRTDYFWDTGQLWVDPSPNMRDMKAAILYPGVCLLEQTNVSVGRGTARPFELIGAPWIEPRRLARELRAYEIEGLEAVPVYFTPDAGKHRGIRCGGVSLTITDVEKLNSAKIGLSLVSILHRLYKNEFQVDRVLDLLGNAEVLKRLKAGEMPEKALKADHRAMREFMTRRKRALLY